MEINIHPDEAKKVAGYLLNYSPNANERDLYHSYVQMKNIALTRKENRLWSLMLGNKLMFYFIDCGLGFFYQQSPIRQRILCMLGVLETQPHLAEEFLPVKISAPMFLIHLVKASVLLPFILLSGLFLKIYLH